MSDLGRAFRFLGERRLLDELAVLNGFVTEAQLRERPLEEWITADQRAELCRQREEAGPSTSVGSYALDKEIGRGATGVVWKAWDARLGRWVALKELRLESPAARERFQREARAAARVSHPHLVQAYETFTEGGRDFLALQYVDGKPLQAAGLDLRAACAAVADVCDAVKAMHEAGVLHRDVKPQNILVDAAGGAWLADFGLARDVAQPALTREGSLVGTPLYMSPEQATGKALGPATDVYGLGATLYHAVTGRAPFEAGNDVEALLRKLSTETPVLDAGVPRDLGAIILHALEKDPSDRYVGAGELGADLRRFLRGEPVAARPAGPLKRGARWVRRRAAVAGMAAALALVAVLALRGDGGYGAAFREGTDLWMKTVAVARSGKVDRPGIARAMGRFEAAAAASPRSPEPWLMRGRCLMILGDGPGAERAWGEALAREGSFGPALLERGKYYAAGYLARRLPPGVRVSGANVRFGPPEPESGDDRAWRDKARADLARARGLDPVERKYIEGALAFGEGRAGEAASALREYVAANPWDAPALALHAAAAYVARDFEAAEGSLDQAIALEPRAAHHQARGDVRYCRGKFKEAEEDYSQALRLEPENPTTRCNRGLVRQALRDFAGAVADYGRAIELRPGFARAHNNRGTARVEMLDLAAATADFEKAVELSPFYAEAYNNLGNALWMQQRVDDAIREYDMAIEIDRDYAEAYANRAMARRTRGETAAALADFEAAVRGQPSNPDLLFELAVTAEGAGDVARASASLRRALDLAPPDWPRRPRASQLLASWQR